MKSLAIVLFHKKTIMEQKQINEPSAAFIATSWTAFFIGTIAFIISLWNAGLEKSEKGFYPMSFVLSLFAAIAVQKNTRDIKVLKSDTNL